MVDDRVPVLSGQPLLPTIPGELWPWLLAKALVKLTNGLCGAGAVEAGLAGPFPPMQAPETDKTVPTHAFVHHLVGWWPCVVPLGSSPLDDAQKCLARGAFVFLHASQRRDAPAAPEGALDREVLYALREVKWCSDNSRVLKVALPLPYRPYKGPLSDADHPTWTAEFEEKMGNEIYDRDYI